MAAVFLGAGAVGVVMPGGAQELPPAGPHPGVAVVELYTSEGCSSCPPADRVFRELDSWGRQNDVAVFPLSFHVTYWNRLGWTDPFSQEAFSERQRLYAREFGRRSVFTPEAIVNGAISLNGSRAGEIREQVTASIRRGAVARMEVSAERSADRVVITHRVESAPRDAVLMLALTQSGVTVNVPRGENSGRALRHDHVVRVWERAEELAGTTRLRMSQSVLVP